MPLRGIKCPCTGQNETFGDCVEKHLNKSCPCHVPIYMLDYYNQDKRSTQPYPEDTYSATVLLKCPRAFRHEQENDYYMSEVQLWNMVRGTWTHHMMESSPHREHVIRETRLWKPITVDGKEAIIAGTPDEVDTLNMVLMDYKSKDTLPKGPDAAHEAQFNVYVWLLQGGVNAVGVPVDITINRGGMHYITWKTKTDKQFLKIPYPIWSPEEIQEFLETRIRLLRMEDPPCSPYGMSSYWTCDCVKYERNMMEDTLGEFE